MIKMNKSSILFNLKHEEFINHFTYMDINKNKCYFDENLIKDSFQKTDLKSFLQMNERILTLLNTNKDMRFSFSLGGYFLDLVEKYSSKINKENFKKILSHPKTEIVAETYFSEDSNLISNKIFLNSLKKSIKRISAFTGKKINTIKINSNNLRKESLKNIKKLGIDNILINTLDEAKPAYLVNEKINLIPISDKISNDFKMCFNNKDFYLYPFDSKKFLKSIPEKKGIFSFKYQLFGDDIDQKLNVFEKMDEFLTDLSKESDIVFIKDNLKGINKESVYENNDLNLSEVKKNDFIKIRKLLNDNIPKEYVETLTRIISTRNITTDYYDYHISLRNILEDIKIKINN